MCPHLQGEEVAEQYVDTDLLWFDCLSHRWWHSVSLANGWWEAVVT
jgi:hypothetical protein